MQPQLGLILAAVKDLARALVIGVVVSVPFTLMLAEFPHALQYTFFKAPADHAALEAWFAAQPGVRDVRLAAVDGGGLSVEFVAQGRLRGTPIPPLASLGYALQSVTSDAGLLPRIDSRLFLILLLAVQVGFAVVGVRCRRRMLREGQGSAGARAPAVVVWRTGLVAGVVLFGFGWVYGSGLEKVLPAGFEDPSPWLELQRIPGGLRVAVVAAGVLVAPVCEELLFRGVFYARVAAAGHPLIAAWLSALLFAGVHFDPLRFPAYVVFGLVLAGVYRRVGSLVAPVVAHAVNNGAAFAVLLASR